MTKPDDIQPRGTNLLLKSLVAGIIVGLTSFVIALALGKSFWSALLYYTIFGFFGMLSMLIKNGVFPHKENNKDAENSNYITDQS